MSNQHINTAPGVTFFSTGDLTKKQYMFAVAPGVDMADALNSASDLLSTVSEAITDAGTGDAPLAGNSAWLVLHTINSAKAVIDALWLAAEQQVDKKESAA